MSILWHVLFVWYVSLCILGEYRLIRFRIIELWGDKGFYSFILHSIIKTIITVCVLIVFVYYPMWGLTLAASLFALLLAVLFGGILVFNIRHSLQMRHLRERSPSAMYLKTSSLFHGHRYPAALAQAEITLRNPALNTSLRGTIHLIRAICFYRLNRMPDSLDAINLAIEINPACSGFVLHRGKIYVREGRYSEAMEEYATALKLAQNGVDDREVRSVQNNIAWDLATSPEAKFRNGKRALELAKQACGNNNSGVYADTLAAAYAEVGQFEEAITLEEDIVSQCPKEYEPIFQERLALYKKGIPYRSPPRRIEMVKNWSLK